MTPLQNVVCVLACRFRREQRGRFPSSVIAGSAISLLIIAYAHTLKVGSFAAAKGEHLTHEELKASYVVIRHNVRTYESGGVV